MLAISGELDVATAPQLRIALLKVSGVLELDCTGLSFIDSVGIGVLIGYACRSDSKLELTNVGPVCWRILEIAGVADRFGATPRLNDTERADAPENNE